MPLNPKQLQQFRGHPTCPGPRDPYELRVGDSFALDGTPGLPRLRPTEGSNGPGIPGPTPSGPMQPGVEYEDYTASYTEPSTQLISDIGKQGPFAK